MVVSTGTFYSRGIVMGPKISIPALVLLALISNSSVAEVSNDEQISAYAELISKLDHHFDKTTLTKKLRERISYEGSQFVIVKPVQALYELEVSAGNKERALLIKNFMDNNSINLDRNYNIRALTAYQCKANCLAVLTSTPLHSYDELAEAFGGLRALDPNSSYARTGLNSLETFRLLSGPMTKKEMMADEYAKILHAHDLSRSVNGHREMIDENMNRFGFISGFVKPFLISREIFGRNGEAQVTAEMDSMMSRYGLRNDFSVFSQRDLSPDDRNGKGEYLSRKIDMVSSQYKTTNKPPSPREISVGFGTHYLNSRIEDATGSSPKALAEEAKKVKTLGDATAMMGKILYHTTVDTVIRTNETLTKISDAIDLAKVFNDTKADRNDEQSRGKTETPKVENKTEPKKQEKKEDKKKEEPKKEEPKKEKEEKTQKEPKEKKDPLPTEDEHTKGEEYLLPDAIIIRRPDVDILTPEQREALIKESIELKKSAVIYTSNSPNQDQKAGIVPKPIVNPINSTPVVNKDVKAPVDLQKEIQKKKDIVINPGAPRPLK